MSKIMQMWKVYTPLTTVRRDIAHVYTESSKNVFKAVIS